MDKTPSPCAVDKYTSKISKTLTCTRKFKIIVLVPEVWWLNFLLFFVFFFFGSFLTLLCAWIKMHNIKRPDLLRVPLKFSTTLLLASTAAMTFS